MAQKTGVLSTGYPAQRWAHSAAPEVSAGEASPGAGATFPTDAAGYWATAGTAGPGYAPATFHKPSPVLLSVLQSRCGPGTELRIF